MKTGGADFAGRTGPPDPSSAPEATGPTDAPPAAPRPAGPSPSSAQRPPDGLDQAPFSSGVFDRFESIERSGGEPGKGVTADDLRNHFAIQDLWDKAASLPPDLRHTLLKAVEKAPTALSEPLQRLAGDPRFGSLPASTQTLAVEQLGRHTGRGPAERAALGTLTALATHVGFGQLREADQLQLLRYVGGKNAFISDPGRAALDTLIRRPDFAGDTPVHQAAKLKTFLDDQTGTPELVPPGGGAPKVASSTVSPGTEVAGFAFVSGKADAVRHNVIVGGQTISVTLPKNPPAGGSAHTLAEVRQALAELPPNVRATIKEVRVNPGANPDDAYWQAKYKDPGHVSYMTAASDGVIDIYSTGARASLPVMVTSMIHETGHVISGQAWGDDTNDPRWGPFKSAIAKDGIVASSYGKSSPADDFAEGWALYSTVKGTPQEADVRALMPERFKLFDQLSAGPR
jgi:hypothetical protein